MKPDLILQRKIMNVIRNTTGGQGGVWKFAEILTSGNFTVPVNLIGNTIFVTGCGGGGSGYAFQANAGNGGLCTGGAGGYYVDGHPVTVSPGEIIPVTIGAGGAAAVGDLASPSSKAGNPGGDTIFKTLVIKGGEGGTVSGTSGLNIIAPRGGFTPSYFSIRPDVASTTMFAGDYIHGPSSGYGSSGKPAYISASSRIVAPTGGAAGMFGDGGSAAAASAANATAESALPNTGAGGGAAAIIYATATRDKVCTSGAGGSGRLILVWQEFAT